ncbi:type II toxin-antitoxin system HicB family antitoxin [Candidatus Daviesbacteria bacterium]|nr:type II toxin-antitoxin system HicB family antitoxin [Candidatus Daviesbacteria bacterium]
MKQKVANYTVVIKKEKRIGTNKGCYSAYVPILEVATEADTFEQVQKEIKSLVAFHLESLTEEGEKIPIEIDHPVLTSFETEIPKNAHLTF